MLSAGTLSILAGTPAEPGSPSAGEVLLEQGLLFGRLEEEAAFFHLLTSPPVDHLRRAVSSRRMHAGPAGETYPAVRCGR
ncbi:hypothetical protein CYMTET_33780 [Cymbomonas tetramitiformis]|uniref:Uncharacterized protein n=1 Tax=Cymbomonas tetramitiformis TaxID=36881 RepID=A0AAE0FCA1_9CHLO|nr:hypothetical protein CYMTET_33780 [Cymbomonas tetramitiformis]